MHNKFELLARWGYAARGIVYLVLGALALWGAGATTTEDALSTVLAQPFGRILLAAVAIGLIGHVLWRLAQGILNADHVDNDAKGIIGRIASVGSAVVNAALAFTAATMALGNGGSGSGSGGGESEMTASAMQLPFGNIIVGLVGLGLIAGGLVQVWRGLSKGYQKRIKLPSNHETILHAICATGLTARGLLLAVTGGFLAYAAITVNPEQAGGLSDALDWVHSLPFGGILYALAAIGLIAFGLYSGIQARYREVDAPDSSDLRQAAGKVPGIPA
jgi:hypothetical protein